MGSKASKQGSPSAVRNTKRDSITGPEDIEKFRAEQLRLQKEHQEKLQQQAASESKAGVQESSSGD